MGLLKSALAHLRGKANAGRNVIVLPDDVFVVSYPRSGNTWTRFLIANLVHKPPVNFLTIEKILPDIYVNSNEAMLRLARPRILKSHEVFDPRYRKVIYIARDPRDVAVSYYHLKIKRREVEEDSPIEHFVEGFIQGAYNPRFGSWAENVSSWLGARLGNPGFLWLRYEDIAARPVETLRKISSFLGLKCETAALESAVSQSSAENMRTMERTQGRAWRATKAHRQDKPFVRRAAPGGWRTELPPAAARKIAEAWMPIMDSLGYGDDLTAEASSAAQQASPREQR